MLPAANTALARPFPPHGCQRQLWLPAPRSIAPASSAAPVVLASGRFSFSASI